MSVCIKSSAKFSEKRALWVRCDNGSAKGLNKRSAIYGACDFKWNERLVRITFEERGEQGEILNDIIRFRENKNVVTVRDDPGRGLP